MKRCRALIPSLLAVAPIALGAGCAEEDEPTFVQAQYDVTRWGTTTVTLIGELENNYSADLRGFCTASEQGGQLHIDIQVSEQDNSDALVFEDLRWSEGSTACVSCGSMEIVYDDMLADEITCCGEPEGTCSVWVRRGEPKHSVEINFECQDVPTNTMSGGSPVLISVSNGRMLIENCSGM